MTPLVFLGVLFEIWPLQYLRNGFGEEERKSVSFSDELSAFMILPTVAFGNGKNLECKQKRQQKKKKKKRKKKKSK